MCVIENDGDVCTVWDENWVRARKEHKCSCCDATIVIGERHLVHRSLYESDWSSGRLCRPCSDARDAFQADPHHEVIPHPSSFVEMLANCIDDSDEESVTKWRPMLDQIRARQEASKTRAV